MNSTILLLAERLPGLCRGVLLAVGEGLEPSYRHTWFLPPSVTVLFLLIVLGIISFLYWQERGHSGMASRIALIVLRMTLVGLVVFMLYGWMQQHHVTDLADVIVIIDDSESMSLKDQLDDSEVSQVWRGQLDQLGFTESDRLNMAKTILLQEDARLLSELEQKYHVKVFRMGRSLRAVDAAEAALPENIRAIQAREDSSRLGDNIRDVLDLQRGRPTAAIIVLTDGVTTAGPSLGDVSKYSRRKGIPLHIVGLGNARALKDVRVSDLFADRVTFVDDLLHFDFKLSATGMDQQEVMVRLERAGSHRILTQQKVKIEGEDYTQTMRLSYRPQEVGEFEFVVVADSATDSDLANNRDSQEVRVTDETIRVLLVQEYPSYEFRAIRNLLSRGLKRTGTVAEKAIELTTILQEADLQYVELDTTSESTFPVNREELYAYDVIIFGDVNRKLLSESALQNLSDFVTERGGGLILIAGPRHLPLAYRETPLEKLFPADMDIVEMPRPDQLLIQESAVRISRLGQVTPHVQLAETADGNASAWQRLPGLRWLLALPRIHSGVRVLVERPAFQPEDTVNLPVVSLQFVGAGKVVFHATDETWRWLGAPDGEHLFDRYWLQTIRYLSRSKLLGKSRQAELTSHREEYRQGDSIELQVRFFDDRLAPPQDDAVTVVIDREQGNRRKIVMRRETGERGMFSGRIGQLTEGKYRAWLATPTLDGEPPATVFRVLRPDQEMTRKQMDEADLRLAAKISRGRFYLPEQVDRLTNDLPVGRQVRVQSQPAQPLWNSPWWATLFLLLLTGEWLLRKRAGML
jgi:uncharacterized membrane protein